jgi:UDP-glucose 4-epimerase
MEKILITGVAGFIGSHVAQRFLQEGFKVVGIDDLSGGRIENVPTEVDFIQGDLSLEAKIGLLQKDCNKILHLAG